MRVRTRHIAWLSVLLGCLAGGIVYCLLPGPARVPLENQAYVWQTRWNNEVVSAVDRAAPLLDGFMVLYGEADYDGKEFHFSPAYPEPRAGGKPMTMVLRIKTRLSKALASDGGGAARAYLEGLLSPYLQSVSTGTSNPAVQIDYDCPTGALKDYGGLVKGIRESFPGAVLSVTALPDWLKSDGFSGVVSNVDYFVLQVHSLERPTTFDAPYTLCDPEKARAAVRRAEKLGRRFYIALPTYTYRLVFDDKGTFQYIGAEQLSELPPPTWRIRDVAADPGKTAELVREWHARPPRNCLGLVWFRLPVDSDRFNLRWPAFEKVVSGEAPKCAITAEMRQPDPGLYELWLGNSGDYMPAKGIECTIQWKAAAILAYDVIGGYRVEPNRESDQITIHGPSPREDAQPVLAAWFRVRPEFNGRKDVVQCGAVSNQ